MKRELKFILQNLTTSEDYNAHPIYADDISLVSEKESGQVFFREKLNTQLTFVGADYSWIMAQAFDDAILVILFIKENGVLVKGWYGKFMRTDCTINEIDTIIKVTPEPRDDFNDILSIMDREVNIKDLNIANSQIYMPMFDIVQLYKPNSSSITNYANGEIWSVDVSREISRHSDLTGLQFYNTFGWLSPRLYNGISATFTMQSYVRTYQSAVTLTMTDTTSTYTLDVSISETNSYNIVLQQGGVVLGTYDGINDNGAIRDTDNNPVCLFSLSHTPIYSRYLSASGGSAEINDFGAIGKNYRYVKPLTSVNRYGLQIGISTAFSNSPTQWGAVYTNGTPTGQYYAPHAWFGYDALPFMQNYWSGDGSIWFMILKSESTNIPYSQMLIADCYEIGDLINAILSSQNVGIVLPKNSVGSEFLYSGTSPISGWHNGYEIYFTAKSNVANINADEPAASVKCTLGTVLNFLKNALNVRWTLVSGYLKVEHIAYFKNGGSYGSTPAIGYDLTTMINPRNNKPWAFGQNDYSFEKNKMPEFVKWEWMDETDIFFDGSGFNCISKYVQQGNTESINIANVTSNVGFVATRPDQITLDGLCVFLTVNYRINVGTCSRPTLGGVYNVANPEMAMWNLQQGVLLYDAPCDTIAVSDTTYNAVDAVLTKTSEVTFPALIVDVLKLIKTNVGDGVIDSITNNINNYNVKIKLFYNGKEMTRLVEGVDFVRAEWLCGRNGAYIDTNYYLNTIEDSFYCHFRWDGATENPLGKLNGVFGNYSNNVFARVGIRYGKYFIDYKKADGSFNMLNIQSPYDAEIHLRSAVDKYSFELNGTHYEYSNNAMEQIQLTSPVYVFENIADNGTYFHGDIAAFKITDTSSNTKMYLTPCRLLRPIPAALDANGIARQAGECGMFDSISGKFYGNVASSGSFTVSDN